MLGAAATDWLRWHAYFSDERRLAADDAETQRSGGGRCLPGSRADSRESLAHDCCRTQRGCGDARLCPNAAFGSRKAVHRARSVQRGVSDVRHPQLVGPLDLASIPVQNFDGRSMTPNRVAGGVLAPGPHSTEHADPQGLRLESA